jgi:predicted amidohydrolase
MRMADEIGTLRVGAWGDAVVFDLQEGPVEFRDSHGKVRVGRQRLAPTTVVRAGKVYGGPAAGLGHAHRHD